MGIVSKFLKTAAVGLGIYVANKADDAFADGAGKQTIKEKATEAAFSAAGASKETTDQFMKAAGGIAEGIGSASPYLGPILLVLGLFNWSSYFGQALLVTGLGLAGYAYSTGKYAGFKESVEQLLGLTQDHATPEPVI